MNLKYMRQLIGVLALLTLASSLPAEPLTIIEAVQRALATHPQSQSAAAIVDEARGERRSATALPAPKLFIRWDDIPSGSRLASYEEKRVGFSQELDFPLRYLWEAKAANLTVTRAQFESRMILLDLEAEVKQTYLEAWASTEKTRILKDNRDTLSVHCERIQEMGKQGEYSPLEVRGYIVNLRQADFEYQASQRSLIAAREKLTRLISGATDEVELVAPLESDPIDTTQFAAETPSCNNPQIAVDETRLRLRQIRKTMAKYDWLPELQLTCFDRVRLDRPDRDSWAFELELTIPLWFGWGGVGRIQAREADLRRVQAELASSRLAWSSECLLTSQELKSTYEQSEFYRKEMVPLAEDKVQAARKNLQLGGADYEGFIEEWIDFKKARLKAIDIKLELYRKKIYFDKLRGDSFVR